MLYLCYYNCFNKNDLHIPTSVLSEMHCPMVETYCLWQVQECLSCIDPDRLVLVDGVNALKSEGFIV